DPELHVFRLRRNTLVACALVFYASIAIGYVSTTQLESTIWFIVLVIAIMMSVLSSRLPHKPFGW
ncbi:MAG TPA: hypothetical protein VLU38_05285, partial [Methanomassiliicoccales archaeon]|nr:hypothetical protein [Methanomassiliicoccales archaeon]